jgi:Icc-related predicted phosphoesterase
MVRIAAVGDLHIKGDVPADLVEALSGLDEAADLLVVAGDITNGGKLAEAEAAAEVLALSRLPILAVMGNHDRRCLRRKAFYSILSKAGVDMLDGEIRVMSFGTETIGFAGIGGSGGGFWPDAGPDAVHSRAMQRLRVKARLEATRLDLALQSLETHDVDHTVVITHFAPTINTLGVEPEAKYWMLGNVELGRTIDRFEVDLVLHGHAHLGNPMGRTPNGILVRNVAQSVTGGVVVHELERDDSDSARWPSLERTA